MYTLFNISSHNLLKGEIESRLDQWVGLLANGRYSEAATALTPTPNGILFTESEIRHLIGLYDPKYVRALESGTECLRDFEPKISHPSETKLGEKFLKFERLDESIIQIIYSLPIAGEWSDRLAEFYYFPINSHTSVLGLESIFS